VNRENGEVMKTIECNIKPITWQGRLDVFAKMLAAAMLALQGKSFTLSISGPEMPPKRGV